MRLGFNNNIPYKGETIHIQTEDSGMAKPVITTLIYKGGVILGSSKLAYNDILSAADIELIVDDLMKEEHKSMIRRLRNGEFDSKIFKNVCTAQPKIHIPQSMISSNPVPSIGNVTTEVIEPMNSSINQPPTLDATIYAFFGVQP